MQNILFALFVVRTIKLAVDFYKKQLAKCRQNVAVKPRSLSFKIYTEGWCIHAISDEAKLTKSHGSLQSSSDVKIVYIFHMF